MCWEITLLFKFPKLVHSLWLLMALFWRFKVKRGTLLFKVLLKHSFFHLRNIARLHPMLNFSVAEKLINSFAVFRIDYCNTLLAGVFKSTLNELKYIENSAVRTLTGSRICNHITPVLESLHWLLVRFRVDCKIMMLTYKSFHGLAPLYLSELLNSYPKSQITLFTIQLVGCSSNTLKIYGWQGFLFICSSPLEFSASDIIKPQLQTYFFKLAFVCWCLLLLFELCIAYFVYSALRSCYYYYYYYYYC